MQGNFNTFAQETQKAFQQLRQELHADKRVSLTLMNELMDLAQDLSAIVAARPKIILEGEAGEHLSRWMDAIDIQYRKVHTIMEAHGVHRYDAVIGSAYNPALHERVGSAKVEGMDSYRIAEQREHGYASQQPDFVIRRAKVIVTE
jgi:molecular chaperone GrpE (heat shock protein)